MLEIDGARTRGFGSSWALLPGPHEVLLGVQIYTDAPNMRWTAWSYCWVALHAEAGEKYVSRVRIQKEIAPGLKEKVKMEVGIADAEGTLRAVPFRCQAERPSSKE